MSSRPLGRAFPRLALVLAVLTALAPLACGGPSALTAPDRATGRFDVTSGADGGAPRDTTVAKPDSGATTDGNYQSPHV